MRIQKNDSSTHLPVSLVGGTVAGMAVYRFLRGHSAEHSFLRSGPVIGQLLVGVAVAIHGWRRHAHAFSTAGR